MKTNRGSTFHEHYDKLGLINMNGRVYDPIVGRFLSVDPVVSDPLSAQSYNGYSYCLNNPLKYTDPSGYTSMSLSEFIKNGLKSTYGGYWESDGSGSGSGSSYMFTEEQSFQAGANYNNFHDSWGYTEYHNGATVTSSTSIHFNARMLQRSPSWNIGFFQRIARSFTTTKEYGYSALAPAVGDMTQAGGIMLQNETDGFNRIWNSSFSEKTEYAALVTPRGLITFNAGKNGGDLFGGLTSSWKGNKCSVVFQGKSYQVLGSVHVHWDKTCDATPTPYDPTTGSGDNGAAYYTLKGKIPLFVLGWDKTIYETGYTKLAYQSGFRQNHFNVKSLLSGELSLINILQLNQ